VAVALEAAVDHVPHAQLAADGARVAQLGRFVAVAEARATRDDEQAVPRQVGDHVLHHAIG
jgi:hypothetical protein